MTNRSSQLIKKYNVPTPRYTSYPTVPMWTEDRVEQAAWKTEISRTVEREGRNISLYIHLPFCESLCTFCGCNKRITKNHAVEEEYIEAVLKEWNLYTQLFGEKPVLDEIHLGGGTPTFFSSKNLKKLISKILSSAEVPPDPAFSFEGNPRNTTRDQLDELYNLGFRRASYGIQDFDPKVQDIINRIQDFDLVSRVVDETREAGFEAINFDLVYGLPFQTLESIDDTYRKVDKLKPERIAYYSYAHVPWVKGVGQRRFSEKDLPRDEGKRALYERGRYFLNEQGYEDIGMDHFALPHDELYQALQTGNLFRNFMGYTVFRNRFLIGLGVSSINDSWSAFAQNEKVLEDYYRRLEDNEIPVFRGHYLTEEDLSIREHILNIMCKGQTTWQADRELSDILERLEPIAEDGLIQITDDQLRITDQGKPFIRNICMAFDRRLWAREPESQLFSLSI